MRLGRKRGALGPSCEPSRWAPGWDADGALAQRPAVPRSLPVTQGGVRGEDNGVHPHSGHEGPRDRAGPGPLWLRCERPFARPLGFSLRRVFPSPIGLPQRAPPLQVVLSIRRAMDVW